MVVWSGNVGVGSKNECPQLGAILPLRVSSCNCTGGLLKCQLTILTLLCEELMIFCSWHHFIQSGVCGCEKGYTEVMTSHGFLDYCTRTPGVDNSKKADVKTNSGRLKPRPSQANNLFSEWTLRPVGPGTEIEILSKQLV